MTAAAAARPIAGSRSLAWRAAAGLCGLLSVSPLLAWVFGLGRFSTWFLALALPAQLGLVAMAATSRRRPDLAWLRVAIGAGVLGGLIGTLGYDLFRLPFVAGGLRLLAPIDSYGVLLLGADSSSGWSGLAGWGYHFANGIGFGVAYAMVGIGRHWGWAILWAMVLETATVLTPFASTYGLQGKWHLIAIAYAAHLFYGYPLGRIVQSAAGWSRPPVRPWMAVAALSVALVVWHRPLNVDPNVAEGKAVPGRPSAVIRDGRFVPEWLRVRPGQCATIENRDAISYRLPDNTRVAAGARTRLCPDEDEGVHRVRLTGRAYSGGFVIVDPAG